MKTIFTLLFLSFVSFTQIASAKLVADFVTQPLNHSPLDTSKTLKQRFWILDTYAKSKNAPVIYMFCYGDSCDVRANGKQAHYLGEQLGAYVIRVEQRNEGESVPAGGVTQDVLLADTNKNILTDFYETQKLIQKKYGLTGKWLNTGCSFDATSSAFYKVMFPDAVVGTYAAGSVVHGFGGYGYKSESIDRLVSSILPQQCRLNIQSAIQKAEAFVDAGDFEKLKKMFQAESFTDSAEFFWGFYFSIVQNVADNAINFVCDEFKTGDITDLIKFSKKISGGNYNEFSLTKWTSNPKENTVVRAHYYRICKNEKPELLTESDRKISIGSKYVNIKFHQRFCERTYGIKDAYTGKPIEYDFYSDLLNPLKSKNILFINGENDPWATASISIKNKNNTNSLHTYYDIKNVGHCAEYSQPKDTDNVDVAAAKKFALAWMRKILTN